MWQLRNDLPGDVGVSLGRDENREAWRGEQRGDELPRRWRVPRPSHDPRVGCIETRRGSPGGVPGIRSRPLAFEPIAAGAMKLRVGIGGVNQHIGDRRRALATFHRLVQGVAVGNIDECAAAAECRQGGDSPPLSLRAEQ